MWSCTCCGIGVWWLLWSIGIETGKALLEEIEKEKERSIESENQTFLLEPLLALTGSLSMTQNDAVSSLKCDIPRQLYLSGKVGVPELYYDYVDL